MAVVRPRGPVREARRGGFAGFMGQWSVWTFGFGEPKIWASVWILLAFSTLFFAGYQYIEKFQSGVVILLIVFVMGMFLDGISIVVLTTAVLMPAISAAGIDVIWFGIFLILVVEMAQITPPVGFNLFVIQGITGRKLPELVVMALPFFLLLVLATALITVFPQIVSALPNAMR